VIKVWFTIFHTTYLIEAIPCFSNSCGVRKHANGSWNGSLVGSRHNCWGFVVDSDFETSWAPINKLNKFFKIDNVFIENVRLSFITKFFVYCYKFSFVSKLKHQNFVIFGFLQFPIVGKHTKVDVEYQFKYRSWN
jgi:hypothetical protein